MPRNPSITLPKQSPFPMPSSHSYTVMEFRSIPNDDEDDICPVCESECTCGNTNSTPQAQPVSTGTTLAPLSLKIKLPPRKSLILAPKPTVAKRARHTSHKQKETIAGSATVDGGDNDHSTMHSHPHFSGSDREHRVPPPVSPTSILRGTSPLTPEPELPPLIKAAKPKRPAKASTPKIKKIITKATPRTKNLTFKKNTIGSRRKKDIDGPWTATSSRRKGRSAIRLSSDESEDKLIGHDQAYVTQMHLDSDGDESVQFPTFISASAISSTSGNDNDSVSITDSFDSDCSARGDEDMILIEERVKLRREILDEESWHMEKRKWDHLKNNNNWEIRPRKKSVGAGETESETGSDSESEVQAGEDEEDEEGDGGDDDDDPDIRYGRGMVTGWQSDDDFDAELFFATLTDSSGPGSDADVEDGEESADDDSDDNSDLSTISITEAAAAGLFSSPFGVSCPLVVTEDWDGRLVFANGLKDGEGVLDAHFEVAASQRQRSIHEAVEVKLDNPERLPEDVHDEHSEDGLISDNGSETTDDMFDHGIVPIPFRFPTPPVTSINPLSTFSPVTGARRKLAKDTIPAHSPKPADILANAGKVFLESGHALDKDSNGELSASASVASPPGTTTSTQSRQMPSLGSFHHVSTDPRHSAIIDGTKKKVFSPFSRTKHVRKGMERGRKRTATGNDIFPYISKRSRQSSLPDSNRALVAASADEVTSPLVRSSPELPPPAASIGLDDVLDTAFLDSDEAVEAVINTSGERHLRNLTRWDRIPMDTFRRSRAALMDENNVRVSALAPPNDGVSYGSAAGHVLRKTPLGAALWQTNSSKTIRPPPGTVPVSPVIFPTRNGDPMVTSPFLDPFHKPLASDNSPTKSRKQKRKEKKKKKGVSPAHTRTSNYTTNGFYLSYNVPPLNL